MWPPTLEDFKNDKFTDIQTRGETRDDATLQLCLDAAITSVEQAVWWMDFTNDVLIDKPKPNAMTVLGTLRQANRWYIRRESPEGVVQLGDVGGVRIPGFDPDIERLLGIGRFGPPVLA